ncbi:hypothetical protein C5Y96_16935 [Blastopirellula marina]|uniref:Uncharacterized protein n=1 Tax=Blastopirellula marina TaxID=124 RepID=A0A2S8F7C5_9BACT|nr:MULTISPECIES: hypothetical protein [Pirellulaceae]PQO28059.1 hypothetical protein C5Y96_16935 [Blastopirellula marina]RCS48484.1 hypothetical protein DTL36_16955 [Bremerella cremea]
MKFVVLPNDDFTVEYHKAFEKIDLPTDDDEERFQDEISRIQEGIESALGSRWQVGEDFGVGSDFDDCYHVCGGIYNDTILSEEYVRTVIETLQKYDPNGVWTYHTSCEFPPAEGTDENWWFGEMFFRAGICYINGERFPKPRREQLGCRE